MLSLRASDADEMDLDDRRDAAREEGGIGGDEVKGIVRSELGFFALL